MESRIREAIEDLRNGNIVLIYDADGREEETDLVVASQFTTPDVVRTLRKDGGGLIFLMVHPVVTEKFKLPFLTDVYEDNSDRYPVFKALVPNDIPYDTKSSFSLTINHRKTFTGITDVDRAMTMSEFAKLAGLVGKLHDGYAMDLFGKSFRSPGHIPICAASQDILKERFGHTELSVALLTMADLIPVATGCEMMGDDGNSLSKEKAMAYAKEVGHVFLEGSEIIEAWKEWSE
ncbi:MAG: 3,4-dihydroxy-2-butanone-4-phosphate synthase [Methanomassiliicoccales archaeon]|nr:MAG: 3,4-dihydroxy-2-butanone-4-phosphate synthase [Methanomassiliicoccales archaeon]